jgi:hypothetical protein
MYPTAERLLRHCDAVLRLPGESAGADQDVRIAQQRGLPIYDRVEDIPNLVRWPGSHGLEEGPGNDAGVGGPACSRCGHVDRLIT